MAFEYDKEFVEELVIKSQNGDSDAFGKIYDIFVDAIYRYIYYRVKNDEVEDLVEITFLRSFENIKQYKKGKSYFSSWLFKIAHNLVVDYYRTQDRVVLLDEKMVEDIVVYEIEHQPVKNTEFKLNNKILGEALSKLKKQYQDIIILKFINGLTNEEIGEILGKKPTALRVLQFRALKELKQLLEYYEFDY